jgi:polar amino acid transport system substrate-binding protein
VVQTNAFFAPFEFYKDRKIVGVDIEIINRTAKKLNKTIQITNVEFDTIVDNVEAGKIADAGAAGLTITPAREKKVNFTIPYYTSVQYVIYNSSHSPAARNGHLVWENLAGAKIGSQTGSTGYMFASDEIENGALTGTGAEIKGMDSHQIAADAILANIIDYAIADELAAKFIIEKNPGLLALPLYYMGDLVDEDYPVEESYAIAVNKERTELLAAFNDVLGEMLKKDESGLSTVDRLVLKYMGLSDE